MCFKTQLHFCINTFYFNIVDKSIFLNYELFHDIDDCPPGQEIGSSNNCTHCAVGFYRGVNDPHCQRCPAGLLTLNMSSTSLADCVYGKSKVVFFVNSSFNVLL